MCETAKEPKGKVLRLPGGRLISFPFLENVRADAVLINQDAEIESFLFDTPQCIPLEKIICPERLGCLNGEILTREIAVSAEKQCHLIHLIQPIEIRTRFLGILTVRALWVDAECTLEGFIRDAQKCLSPPDLPDCQKELIMKARNVSDLT